ncbi:hypothetical protein GYH30_027401 [Glycine max]|uniref:Uncharacterized protein n=1 Tax=Glycine max TaxID=3847 RepID=A0A0R0HQZ9_SOYBN|nr:hypothetical protein GYH30_027401 [Glycine max]
MNDFFLFLLFHMYLSLFCPCQKVILINAYVVSLLLIRKRKSTQICKVVNQTTEETSPRIFCGYYRGTTQT